MKYLRIFIGLAIFITLFSCNDHQETPPLPPEKVEYSPLVKDYFFEDPEWEVFRVADSLKWGREYLASAEVFKSILDENENENLKGEALAYGLNQLAYCYLMLREKELGRKILQRFETTFPSENLSKGALGDYYFNEGIYYQKQGLGKLGILYLKKSLSLYKSIYSLGHLKEIQTLSELSLAYRFSTIRADSVVYYANKAFQLLSQDKALSPFAAQVYYAQAHSCWMRRDHLTGESACGLAIEIAQESKNIDTFFIARCHSLKGRFIKKNIFRKEEALNEFDRAVKLGEQLNGDKISTQELYRDLLVYFAEQKDSVRLFGSISMLKEKYKKKTMMHIYPDRLKGLYYAYKGEYRKSVEWYGRFMDFYLKKENPDIDLLDDGFYGMWEGYLKLNDLKTSENYVWQRMSRMFGVEASQLNWDSLSLPKVFNNFHIDMSYHQLAEIAKLKFLKDTSHTEELDRAFNLYQLIDTMVYSTYDSFDEDAGLAAIQGYFTKIYRSALETCYYQYENGNKEEALVWANHFMERLKSPLFYREYTRAFQKEFPEVPISIFEKENYLNQEIRRYKQKGGHKDEFEYLSLLQEKERLYGEIAKEYPRFYQTKMGQKTISLKQIQEALTGRETIMNYLAGEKYYYLLCIQSDTIAFCRLDEKNKINERVDWIKIYLADQEVALDKRNTSQYLKYAYGLFKQLIEPVLPLIEKETKVFFIPNDNLNYLPFDVLLKEETLDSEVNFKKLPYLLTNMSSAYAPSLKLWFYLKKSYKGIVDFNILAFAFSEPGPLNNTTTRGPSHANIPGTGRELKTIETLYPHAKLYYGQKSTKKHFYENIEKGFNVFHFALHARYGSKNRLNNVVYFPGNPVDSIFGFEFIPMQLKGDLVVLSACQTAMGKTEKGEGAYSLSRSLLLSGCKNIVSSLWEIDDISTAELMEYFYQNLKAGLSPSLSLHQSKKQYLESRFKSFAGHPFFWGGIICLGN